MQPVLCVSDPRPLQYTEYDYYVPPEAVHGTVPEDVRGTLFLIGPGTTEVYGTSVRYPSDGDGMVRASGALRGVFRGPRAAGLESPFASGCSS